MRPSYVLFYLYVLPAALDRARFNVGGYCEVCKMAVTYIDGILEKNSTASQIEEAVRKVCSFLPDSMQTEVRTRGNFCPFLCHSFVFKPHLCVNSVISWWNNTSRCSSSCCWR